MNDTILKIGNVDMSEHVICEAVDISTAPVYSDSFTAVNGKERKKCLGVSVSLSADFQVLSDTVAAALVTACNADEVTVKYKCPMYRPMCLTARLSAVCLYLTTARWTITTYPYL